MKLLRKGCKAHWIKSLANRGVWIECEVLEVKKNCSLIRYQPTPLFPGELKTRVVNNTNLEVQ